jgi:hypothetical protein
LGLGARDGGSGDGSLLQLTQLKQLKVAASSDQVSMCSAVLLVDAAHASTVPAECRLLWVFRSLAATIRLLSGNPASELPELVLLEVHIWGRGGGFTGLPASGICQKGFSRRV